MAQTPQKKHFEFPSDTMPISTPEGRQMRAVEFIAYYLDRIDGHLERIADAAEKQSGPNAAILWRDLDAIAKAIQKHK